MKKLTIEDIKSIAKQLKDLYQDKLISVFVHGVGASDDYNPKNHSLDFAIVLKDNSIEELQKSSEIISKLKKTNAQVSFFMTPEYIEKTLDVFPSEYLNMQANYKVIEGEDILANLKFDKALLRLQCERELRGLLLHLRREFLLHSHKAKELIQLWEVSLNSFIPIFRSVLFLIEEKNYSTPADVLRKMDLAFNKEKVFFYLKNTPEKNDIFSKFKEYVTLLEEVVAKVDEF